MMRSSMILVVGAGAAPLREWSGLTFDQYLQEFGKSYDASEYALRKARFEEKLEVVVAHNEEYKAGRSSWYKAVNHFSDWTEEEFLSMASGKKASVAGSQPPAPPLLRSGSNPSKVDWTEQGKVTGVKNQGNCGSCWAFAAIEVMESHHAIASGDLLTLAPQAYVSCSENPQHCGGTGGCSGSTPELAFNFTASEGVPLETDYPYKNMVHPDDYPCESHPPAVTCSGFVKLPENDANALETAIATIGPVAVSVGAIHWDDYGGGIMDGGCIARFGCSLNHAVVAVGYDNDSGKHGYWNVRNSWGDRWGEGGYIRLTRKNDDLSMTDKSPEDGSACEPYPDTVTVMGESGILYDTSYPVGVAAASVASVV